MSIQSAVDEATLCLCNYESNDILLSRPKFKARLHKLFRRGYAKCRGLNAICWSIIHRKTLFITFQLHLQNVIFFYFGEIKTLLMQFKLKTQNENLKISM